MVRTGFLKRQTSRCSVNMKTVFKRLLSRCSVNNKFKKTIQFFQESTYVGVSLLVKLTVWLPTFTFIFTSYSFRSSDWQIIFKVAILKTLAKLTGKHMRWSPFSTIKGLHQRFFPVNFGKFFERMVLFFLGFSVFWKQEQYFSYLPIRSNNESKWKLFPVSRSKVFSEIIFPKKLEHF